jgi:hypothetical protein
MCTDRLLRLPTRSSTQSSLRWLAVRLLTMLRRLLWLM